MRPARRAARYDGLVPIEVDENGLDAMLDVVRDERGSLDGFEIAVRPTGRGQYEAFIELGATWTIVEPAPGDPDTVSIAAGPPSASF